jgi:hypothetical protein
MFTAPIILQNSMLCKTAIKLTRSEATGLATDAEKFLVWLKAYWLEPHLFGKIDNACSSA